MEPSEAKRKRFSRLSEEGIQNLVEGKDSENTRKATKNAVVTFLAYWNEVKPEDFLCQFMFSIPSMLDVYLFHGQGKVLFDT